MEISIGSYKCRAEICILIILVAWVLFGHLFCSCCLFSFKESLDMLLGAPAPAPERTTTQGSVIEGFVNVGANNSASGPEFSEAKAPGYILNPDSWSAPTLTYSPGTAPGPAAQAILNRPKQPIPLPEGEMDMFATTEFKPECCPNAYTSSTGCACMDMGTYNYLQSRGGNNVPYSEY